MEAHVRLSSAERSRNAQLASLARWRREGDRSAATLPARQAFLRRFEVQVEPERRLPRSERMRRATEAMNCHMSELRAKRR